MTTRTAQKPIARPGAIGELETDPDNLNLGTERGAGLLQHSVETYGLGRGIVADKNGKIIGGNHVAEVAAALGLTEVVFVPHDGRTLVVSQRTDLDLNEDTDATALAILDNQTGAANLRFDAAGLLERAPSDLLARAFTGKEIETLAKAARPPLELIRDVTPEEAPVALSGPPSAPQGRFPLAILLSAADMQRWNSFKLQEHCKTDTEALLHLLDLVSPDEPGIDDQEGEP